MWIKKCNAIIILVDFSKAFDSFDHNFIQSVLKMYGFGTIILNWITTFFTNRNASVPMRGDFMEKNLSGPGCTSRGYNQSICFYTSNRGITD